MHYVYLAILFAGLTYFVVIRRIFDLFAVAFLSSCVYFLPGAVGYVYFISVGAQQYERPIVPEAYLVMSAVLISTVIGTMIYDRKYRAQSETRVSRPPLSLEHAEYWAVVLALTGFVATVLTVGSELWDPDKAEVMRELNRWYTLWETAAVVGFLLAWRK